jgi:hypothetical protein
LPNASSPSAAARFTKVSECLGRVVISAQIAALLSAVLRVVDDGTL